jgi:hypothetical protein
MGSSSHLEDGGALLLGSSFVSHALLGLADPDRWTTTELLLHAIPVSEWSNDFAWCASCLTPSGGTLLDHIVVVNYSAGVPLAVVLEELARALRSEYGMDVHGMIYAR